MSNLSFSGTGTAVEDLKPDAKILKVYLLDIQDEDGELGNKEDVTTIVNDGKSIRKTLVGTKVDYIEALWEGDDNTITAPTIHKGEQVSVIQYRNQEQYYWSKSRGFETDVRGREVKVFGVSTVDREIEGNIGKSATKDNMYYARMDSKNGIVELITNKDNGEKAAYNITINTMEGTFEIKDDLDNSIKLDSVKGILHTKTTKEVNIDTETVNIKCKNYNVTADVGKFNIKKTTFKGDKFTNNVPNNLLDGNLVVNKTTTLKGATTLKAAISGVGGVFKSAVSFLATKKTW